MGFFITRYAAAGRLCAGVCTLVLLWHSSVFAERCAFPGWHRKYLRHDIASERPELPSSYETPDRRFRLHYTINGPDAVSSVDADGNGIPDYVDTAADLLRYVFSVLVDSMRYAPPPSDAGAGGSEAYDVYFLDLGHLGLYGETVPERLLPQGIPPRFTSFLKLDNNYAASDSFGGRPSYRETGTRALRIAIAHEFYHAIQFGNYGIARSGILLYELASTFIEWRIFPDTRDYEQFLPDLFHKPEQCVFGNSENSALGYRLAIFGQYLYLRWGDGVFYLLWEHIGEGKHPYAALDMALRRVTQSSLGQAWCEFLPWLYYTGNRARAGYFPRATEFPMVRFALTERFAPPTVMSSGHLRPFEFRFFRVFFTGSGQRTPDTLDVALTNPDLDAVLHAQLRATSYTFACGIIPGGEPIAGTPYSVHLQGERELCQRVFWNAGFPLTAVGEPYPQPYVLGQHDKLCLPVPTAVPLEAVAEVDVYTLSLQRAAQFRVAVRADDQRLSCCLGPVHLRSGIYVYRLVVASHELWGKLLVREEP
ncbi:MAG: hypothetical protein NZ949_00755 [Candidatus Kapabacteria bacterium]|nr:hypothetical protein [Candidatus Kapabacteria bacterium]